jgi:hypothetical protein
MVGKLGIEEAGEQNLEGRREGRDLKHHKIKFVHVQLKFEVAA